MINLDLPADVMRVPAEQVPETGEPGRDERLAHAFCVFEAGEILRAFAEY